MTLIVYVGGACGNLVAAMIDDSQYILDKYDLKHIQHSPLTKWKEGLPEWWNISDDETRYKIMDQAYNTDSLQFPSIASHYVFYHASRKHDYIGIDITDSLDWCIARQIKAFPGILKFRTVGHREKLTHRNSVVISNTKKIIRVSDIINGQLLDKLSQFVNGPFNEKLYEKWLKANV